MDARVEDPGEDEGNRGGRVGPAGAAAELPAGKGTPVGRRLFLGILGVGAAGVVFGAKVQGVVGDALSAITNTNGSGLGSLIPGANRFRLYTVTGTFPTVADDTYRLAVAGLVRRPMTLSLEDLQSLPRTERVRDFQCVTGWRVPNVEWAGVRLGDLVDLAQPLPAATAVEFSSYDGVYTESLTLEEAHRSDVLVAYQMLNGPISSGHGGPVRLYVAPMYGYKSIKWLRSVELVSRAVPGYWEQEGYAVEAWVGRSNGRHDAPIS